MALAKNQTTLNGNDDLGLEMEYEEQVEYTTASGKQQTDVTSLMKIGFQDMEIGDDFNGNIEVNYFENDKTKEGNPAKSDSIRVRVIDIYDLLDEGVPDSGEYIDFYANIPKPDNDGFIYNLRENFEFYKPAFDMITTFLKQTTGADFVDSKGQPLNKISKINIMKFLERMDQSNHVTVKCIEGAKGSDRNSWGFIKVE